MLPEPIIVDEVSLMEEVRLHREREEQERFRRVIEEMEREQELRNMMR